MANIGSVGPRLHKTDNSDAEWHADFAAQPRPSTSRSTSQSRFPGSAIQSPALRSAPSTNQTPYEEHGNDSSVESPEGEHDGERSIGTDPSQQLGEHRKRPRACDSCRQLKVRCAIDPASGEPCLRCKKAGRACIVTPPTRKRQKKADSRVAELERKIDALTATLQAQREGNHGSHRRDGGGSRSGSDDEGRPAAVRRSDSSKRRRTESDIISPDEELRREAAALPHGELMFSMAHSLFSGKPQRTTLDGDGIRARIDRIISREQATRIFDRYTREHMVQFPIVPFAPGTTADDIRSTKPVLFLAILNSTSYREDVALDVQEALRVETVDVFAEMIWKQAEKSLEMVQALLVSSAWYRIPPVFEQHMFYQMIHTCAIMAIDIGLGKRKSHLDKKWYGEKSPFRKPKTTPDSVEARRTWLVCYYMCISTTMVLRRPILLRFNDFMRESIEYLETASDALPSDKILINHVRLARIAEEVAVEFSMDDPCVNVSVADAKIIYAIRHFEKDLAEVFPEADDSAASQLIVPILDLYIHEIALHSNSDIDDFIPPCNGPETAKGGYAIAGPHHVDALERIQRAARKELETFLSLDIDTIITLPVLCSVRIVYTIVVLIKLYVAATSPGEMSEVIDKAELRIDYFLPALLRLFQSVNDRNRAIPQGKFFFILQRLTERYSAIKRGDVDCRALNRTLQPNPQPNETQMASGSHGGLHLLSEVAVSGTASTPPVGSSMPTRAVPGLPSVHNEWYAPQGMAGVSTLDPAFQWGGMSNMDFGEMSLGGMIGSMGLDALLEGGLFAGEPSWLVQNPFPPFPGGGPWPSSGI